VLGGTSQRSDDVVERFPLDARGGPEKRQLSLHAAAASNRLQCRPSVLQSKASALTDAERQLFRTVSGSGLDVIVADVFAASVVVPSVVGRSRSTAADADASADDVIPLPSNSASGCR